jgi:integrase
MAKKRLTDAFLRGVMAPGRYGDGGRGSFGLSLLVKETKSGGLLKNWHRRYSKDGKYTSLGLGVYPAVTLDQARALAAYFALEGKPLIVREVYRATDEQLEERLTPKRIEIRAEKTFAPMTVEVAVDRELRLPTFRQTFLETVEVRSRGYKEGSKTETQWKNLFNAYIPRNLAERAIEEITARELHDCAAEVWRAKPATAKKLNQILKATFDNAISRELIDADPWERAKKGLGQLKDKGKNQESLAHSEVGEAIRTVRETSAGPTTKLAFEFLVLTAARSGEVRGADWREVDWEKRTWTVPAARMKGKRVHRVPLSGGAMALLENAREMNGGIGLIFPSTKGKVLSDSTLSKLVRENGIPAVPHGFRSSFRDWAAEMTDIPNEIAAHAIAHVEGSASEKAYRRTDYFEKRRELMEQWATYVD